MNNKIEREVIRWWLQFLASSADYRDYCNAVDAGDSEVQQKLLCQHPAIGLVYSDFGDMRLTELYRSEKTFQDWYKSRRHLFEEPYTVREVVDPSTLKFDFTRALLEVQLTDDYEKVKEDVARAMDSIYLSRGHALIWGGLPKRAMAKYELYRGDGTINAATVRAIKKAYYVKVIKDKLETVSGKKVSQTTIVYECKRDSQNPFDWTISAAEEKAVANEGAAQVYLDCSELTTVKRSLKQFNAYMKNALNGRFPVNN